MKYRIDIFPASPPPPNPPLAISPERLHVDAPASMLLIEGAGVRFPYPEKRCRIRVYCYYSVPRRQAAIRTLRLW